MSVNWIIIFAIIFAFLLIRIATPTKPKSGTLINLANNLDNQIRIPKNRLTVATYNVQTGKNLEGKRNINASAEVIKSADLLGIQEVYAPSWVNILGIGQSQTQQLAEKGDFDWLFCATRRRWLREHRGNAVLSKLPIESWRTVNLPNRSKKSFRNMTVLEFYWQGKKIHFINTHLHTGRGRETQLDFVLKEFLKYPYAILVGDFNSTLKQTALQTLLNQGHGIDAISAAQASPQDPNRIDWILTRGFDIVSGEFIEKGVSDHPYYAVQIKLTKLN